MKILRTYSSLYLKKVTKKNKLNKETTDESYREKEAEYLP